MGPPTPFFRLPQWSETRGHRTTDDISTGWTSGDRGAADRTNATSACQDD